jgi:peptidoglycan/LPS O-acetylase OafA/YrhL
MHDQHSDRSSRIFIFDLLRIIFTVLVINLHIRIITQGQPNILEPYTWNAVPLFLVLSFYLSSKYYLQPKFGIAFLKLRLSRLFIPLVFWSVIGFLVHPELFNINNLFLQLITGQVVNLPLYYLNLLIIFTVIFWLLTYLPFKLRLFIYVSIVALAFYLQYSQLNYLQFTDSIEAIKKSYGRFVELIPYAIVGLMFGLSAVKTNKRTLSIIFLVTMISYILTYKFSQPSGFHYSGIQLFLTTTIIFSISLFVSHLRLNNALGRFIASLGKYSFGVYLSHFILLEALIRIFPFLKLYISSNSLLFLIVYIVLCYIVCIFLDILTRRKFSYLLK